MKKLLRLNLNLNLNLSLCLILSLLLLSACNKKKDPEPASSTDDSDKTAPLITLKGKAKDTTALTVAYVDPGATGTDNKDGDISVFIVSSGTVNSNQIGNYQIEYNLRDAAGNVATKAIRMVNVRNAAYYLEGEYNVTCASTTLNPGVDPPLSANNTYTANVTLSSSVNNAFTISQLNIGPVFVVPYTSVNGNTINVMYSNFAYPQGNLSGTVNATKTGFTIITEAHDQSYPNKVYNCTSVFTKK